MQTKLMKFMASEYGSRILLMLLVTAILTLAADPATAAHKCAPWRVSC